MQNEILIVYRMLFPWMYLSFLMFSTFSIAR